MKDINLSEEERAKFHNFSRPYGTHIKIKLSILFKRYNHEKNTDNNNYNVISK